MFYLDSLKLQCFRNYQGQRVKFHPRLNLLVGNNGQGKSNLLEAIFFLSVNRSFRTVRDYELVNYNHDSFQLEGIFSKDDLLDTVKVKYNRSRPLTITLNNNPAKRYDYLQKYPVVVFSPDDLMLISAGPSERRRFLNLEASRLSAPYFKALKAYQRVLIQRNHLLKEKKYDRFLNDYLTTWNEALLDLGSRIIKYRFDLVRELEEEAFSFYNSMTAGKEKLSFSYYSTVFDRYCDDIDCWEDIRCSFEQQLKEKFYLEKQRAVTLVGPHLDDLQIFVDSKEARRYSSQGQKRTAALAMKMAEISLFEKKYGEAPIILLDDVFSEFDLERGKHLFKLLSTSRAQCLITTAVELTELAASFQSDFKVIKIFQGSANDETGRNCC